MTIPLLDLQEVFAVYRSDFGDSAALQGLNLTLASGELLCVLGPSGAGKTTLLRLIAGVQQPSIGHVMFLGQDIGRLGRRSRAAFRHRHIGALGQSSTTIAPDLPVGHAVELPLALRGVSRQARRARAEALLDAAGLGDRALALTGELSGGERQRVALCAALAHEPALLLADEPTGELDTLTAGDVHEMIRAMARTARASVIIASHDLATSAYTDRTITMRDGRIAEELHAGGTALVVSETGWLQVPDELRVRAGIGGRVTASARAGELTLAPAGEKGREPTRWAARHRPEKRAPEHGGPTSWSPAAVEVRQLGRSFEHPGGTRAVLADLTQAFAPGRLTVVTGRSGSGKTTLLRLLAGLDRPDHGAVTIDGHQLDRLDRETLAAIRRDRIGYLAQEPQLVPFLSTRENVLLSLQFRGQAPSATQARATHVLVEVDLDRRATRQASTLSAGELQRAGLARALASAQGLLIADEPTSRLDRANARIVAACLAQAAERDRQTVICASHDPEIVSRAHTEVRL